MVSTDIANLIPFGGYSASPWIVAIILLWTLIWKSLALWKSARLNKPIWFIVFMVLNTLGILEILYIFWLSKINFGSKKTKK